MDIYMDDFSFTASFSPPISVDPNGWNASADSVYKPPFDVVHGRPLRETLNHTCLGAYSSC